MAPVTLTTVPFSMLRLEMVELWVGLRALSGKMGVEFLVEMNRTQDTPVLVVIVARGPTSDPTLKIGAFQTSPPLTANCFQVSPVYFRRIRTQFLHDPLWLVQASQLPASECERGHRREWKRSRESLSGRAPRRAGTAYTAERFRAQNYLSASSCQNQVGMAGVVADVFHFQGKRNVTLPSLCPGQRISSSEAEGRRNGKCSCRPRRASSCKD